jgi:sigma-B regulation protein RsbU (phosphoserine phosphatase)
MGPTTGQLSITIPARPSELALLADAVDAFLAAHDVPPAAAIKLMIALDEMIFNIASHAYAPDADDPFARIAIAIGDGVATLEIVDAGRPFDPLAVAEPDTTLDIDEREIGGLGILLVRKQMDEFHYERRDGHNRLTMVKRLD